MYDKAVYLTICMTGQSTWGSGESVWQGSILGGFGQVYCQVDCPVIQIVRNLKWFNQLINLPYICCNNAFVIFIFSANILLDDHMRPKVGDYGIARQVPTNPTNTSFHTSVVIGTTVYIAPEILNSGHITIQADSYSFGVVCSTPVSWSFKFVRVLYSVYPYVLIV